MGHFAKKCTAEINVNNNYGNVNSFNSKEVNFLSKDVDAFCIMDSEVNVTLEQQWIIDSGAAYNMINDLKLFDSFCVLEAPMKIRIAKKGVTLEIKHVGPVRFGTNLGFTILIENVIFSPELPVCYPFMNALNRVSGSNSD